MRATRTSSHRQRVRSRTSLGCEMTTDPATDAQRARRGPEDPADHAHRQGPAGRHLGDLRRAAAAGVEVLDIEQIVLRRRLVLGVLVTAPRDWKKLRDALERTADDLDMRVEVDRGVGDNRARRDGRSHVTVIGTPLKASAMAAIAGRIADLGRQHRPDRADGALPGHRDRAARLRRRPRPAAVVAGRGGRPAGRRRRRAAREPAPPRHAADRDGRRLHAGPGRGHRDARRARRLRRRGRAASPRRRCAASSTSRSRCARGSRCSRAWRPSALDEVYDADRARPGRPHPGPHPEAARLPVRDRLRRLHPDHRPDRRATSASTSPGPTSSRSSTAG